MPNVGPLELVIVLVIALIIFGPKKLPQLGSSLGRGLREFRSSVSGQGSDSDDDPAELEEPDEDHEQAVDGEVVGENRA
ncbi:MAG: Sec-independent protein translocase subunit TatA/TatB [Solirubrobacterales bacterium]